jgi:signal transduction histidine kinase
MATVIGSRAPTTWFLPPDRVSEDRLAAQVAQVATSAVVETLLRSLGGALAILNAQRQILAVNGAYLDLLGVTDPGAVLGLRPGEALGCRHANECAGGCGTSRACASCGAAAALVASAAWEQPEERTCALAVRRGDEVIELDLRIRAAPLNDRGEKLTMLTFEDVSAEQRRAALERSYFGELAGLVTGLAHAVDAMGATDPAVARAGEADVRMLSARLVRELQAQQALAGARPGFLHARTVPVELRAMLDQLEGLFRHHPAAAGKRLRITQSSPALVLETDPFLLQRVISAMLVNAFEASPAGGEVLLAVETGQGSARFRAWNAGAIPGSVAPRIFQRYFTTKVGEGRGQGTWMMKYFGEKLLGGRVDFTSSPEGGTAFELSVPLAPRGTRRAAPSNGAAPRAVR